MAKTTYGNVLNTIGAGNHTIYEFIELDDDTIKLINVESPEQYILIDKQSLLVFAKIFKELASNFTK